MAAVRANIHGPAASLANLGRSAAAETADSSVAVASRADRPAVQIVGVQRVSNIAQMAAAANLAKIHTVRVEVVTIGANLAKIHAIALVAVALRLRADRPAVQIVGVQRAPNIAQMAAAVNLAKIHTVRVEVVTIGANLAKIHTARVAVAAMEEISGLVAAVGVDLAEICAVASAAIAIIMAAMVREGNLMGRVIFAAKAADVVHLSHSNQLLALIFILMMPYSLP
jgi:hypothetical protein